jgi:hypothetical protein
LHLNIYKCYLIGIFIFTNSIIVISQNSEHFKTIESKGVIPNDFFPKAYNLQFTSDTLNEDKVWSPAFFMINELFSSGKVLFGDSVSLYINKIDKNLIENNQELKSKIRFYVLKSNSVNAFTTNDGMVTLIFSVFSNSYN